MSTRPLKIHEPLIVQASLDPDAVKILRRLKRYGHEAYLVGGCVRDLSLGHIPKDFDIATSARPRQIKRLFRNSRIIGRRFKLVHVQFGDKVIEVSTFRQSPGEREIDVGADDGAVHDRDDGDPRGDRSQDGRHPADLDFDADQDDLVHTDADDDDEDDDREDLLIRRDNVFGSAEEDAVRRDFTINALFYDIADDSVIDYIGGTDDLERRVIRTIGDPQIRFQEDPVRILRAIKFAARLQFDIEPATYDAMVAYRNDLQRCAPPRIAEELLKLLSCGASRAAFDLLDRIGVLEVILPEIAAFLDEDPEIDDIEMSARERIARYLEVVDRVDRGRRILANPTLLTVLLVGPIRERIARTNGDPGLAADAIMRPFSARMSISRRDTFRVKQIVVAQPRLTAEPSGKRRRKVKPSEMVRRDYFKDSLDFFRIETQSLSLDESLVEQWEETYYEHLKNTDPKAFRKARREALFHAPAPGSLEMTLDDETWSEDPGDTNDPKEPKSSRRRGRRRGGRSPGERPVETGTNDAEGGADGGSEAARRSDPRSGRKEPLDLEGVDREASDRSRVPASERDARSPRGSRGRRAGREERAPAGDRAEVPGRDDRGDRIDRDDRGDRTGRDDRDGRDGRDHAPAKAGSFEDERDGGSSAAPRGRGRSRGRGRTEREQAGEPESSPSSRDRDHRDAVGHSQSAHDDEGSDRGMDRSTSRRGRDVHEDRDRGASKRDDPGGEAREGRADRGDRHAPADRDDRDDRDHRRPRAGASEPAPHADRSRGDAWGDRDDRGGRAERAGRGSHPQRDDRGGRAARDDRGSRDARDDRDDRGSRAARDDRDDGYDSGGRGARDDRDDRGDRGARAARDDRDDRGGHAARDDRDDHGDSVARDDRGDRGGRAARDDRDDRGGRVARDDRDDRGGRVARDDRGDRGGRVARDDRGDRGGRVGRDDRGDRGGRAAGDDRNDRGGRAAGDDRNDRGGRAARDDRDDRGNRASADDRDDRGNRLDRDDQNDRGNRQGRAGRGGRGAPAHRRDRPGRPDRSDRPHRNDRLDLDDDDNRGNRIDPHREVERFVPADDEDDRGNRIDRDDTVSRSGSDRNDGRGGRRGREGRGRRGGAGRAAADGASRGENRGGHGEDRSGRDRGGRGEDRGGRGEDRGGRGEDRGGRGEDRGGRGEDRGGREGVARDDSRADEDSRGSSRRSRRGRNRRRGGEVDDARGGQDRPRSPDGSGRDGGARQETRGAKGGGNQESDGGRKSARGRRGEVDAEDASGRRGRKLRDRDGGGRGATRGGRSGKSSRGAPEVSGNERRLEFDEIRGGPLLSGDTFAVEEDDFEVVVHWDDPLPMVGDPGPISVIQTGIDQTEKRGGGGGSGRRKKKSDGASRELSKEVSDKPSLQAFKMIEGDTRGHEATTPRKVKRRPSSMPRVEREQPFDFQSDFEGVEDIFRW